MWDNFACGPFSEEQVDWILDMLKEKHGGRTPKVFLDFPFLQRETYHFQNVGKCLILNGKLFMSMLPFGL